MKQELPYSSSMQQRVLHNINIVLVEPQVPENIGLVARVMKNTGFKGLSLVAANIKQKSFDVAKRARDLLENARSFDTLRDALKESVFVFGTTRRPREFKFVYAFEDIKNFIISRALAQKVSILFGREDFGLSSEELKTCDSVFYLSAAPDFSSYNLASSVGIVCYSLLVQLNTLSFTQSLDLSKKQDIEELFAYLEKSLSIRVNADRLPSIIESLKRIALRTHLTKNEVSLLKGLMLKSASRKA